MSVVVWRDRALDQLADVYVAASTDERKKLSAEVEYVNRRLAENGLFQGESRGGYGRVMFGDLLVIIYSVVPTEPTRVIEVRPNKRLRK